MITAAALGSACGPDATFCERAVEFQRSLPSDGPLEDRVTDALATLDDLVEAAPDEIVGDLAEMRDGIERFIETRRSPGADFAAASQQVATYLADECDALPSSNP